jgi:hypothetical protein
LSIAGDSKAIKVERSDQVRNAFGPPQVCSVTAPATDDGRGALARFHNVVIIQRTNRIRVLEHHLRVSRDQGEKIEHHEPLKAELLSNPRILRKVGSSCRSSAIEGLSPIQAAYPFEAENKSPSS